MFNSRMTFISVFRYIAKRKQTRSWQWLQQTSNQFQLVTTFPPNRQINSKVPTNQFLSRSPSGSVMVVGGVHLSPVWYMIVANMRARSSSQHYEEDKMSLIRLANLEWHVAVWSKLLVCYISWLNWAEISSLTDPQNEVSDLIHKSHNSGRV